MKMVFDTKYNFLMRPDDFLTCLKSAAFTVFSYDLLFIVFQNEYGQSLRWEFGEVQHDFNHSRESTYSCKRQRDIEITTECKPLVPLDCKRLRILIPTHVKAVHFEFDIEFPRTRRFLHWGRRGTTDGKTGRRRRRTKAPKTTK